MGRFFGKWILNPIFFPEVWQFGTSIRTLRGICDLVRWNLSQYLHKFPAILSWSLLLARYLQQINEFVYICMICAEFQSFSETVLLDSSILEHPSVLIYVAFCSWNLQCVFLLFDVAFGSKFPLELVRRRMWAAFVLWHLLVADSARSFFCHKKTT